MDLRRLQKLRDPVGRAALRWRVARRLNRLTYPLGLALFSDHFYQPLPTRSRLVGHQQPCAKVEGTIAQQVDYLRGVMTPVRPELTGELGAFGYPPTPCQLPFADAAVLYATLRSAKPAKVVEVGSGASTQVIAAALRRNADEGHPAEFLSIDPFVTPHLTRPLGAGVSHVHWRTPVQEVPVDRWRQLAPGDVVFVDSTHVYKAGSDVEYEFTTLYPALAPGVLVHMHDIFLPQDYPAQWNLADFRFWNEQQFLAAVLDNSDRYEVLAGLAALHTLAPDVLPEVVPDFERSYSPGSIWLRVTDA